MLENMVIQAFNKGLSAYKYSEKNNTRLRASEKKQKKQSEMGT
jgi:hypothetical protein